ncbi:TPA: hypothetical protein EYG96_03250 [Candidatus Gracilibacteria bacterium]|nr:hypothetical protein [Candidatus Peregrinibacteria bacterium]HIQ57031.1 hypothetical protein [Candidatus Gracilibacteria bacterium]HIQ57248.1 hypothetical protein [Candidatus Gracilibacteria bacterium]
MNLLIIPTLQSCSFIFFTEEKITENITLDKSKTFSESIMLSPFWKNTQNIFFISGPASFTTLRNMSVFLETLKNFSHDMKAENKEYNFYNISMQKFLENFIIHKKTDTNNLFLYSVGKREVFIFNKKSTIKKYEKIKNKDLKEYIQNNNYTTCSGFLSENIITILNENNLDFINFKDTLENNLDFKKLISEENKTNYLNKITIDYGSLPTIG